MNVVEHVKINMRKASETWMQGWMMQKQSSILSAAGVIGLSVAGSSITGLMSNRILTSHFYDATSLTQPILDSYWVAFQPSDMMFQLLVAGAMSASFIPVFSQIKKSNAREAFAVANTVLNGVLLIFALASLAPSPYGQHYSLCLVLGRIGLRSLTQSSTFPKE